MSSPVRRFVFGSPLPTSAEVYQRLNRIRALAVFSSDALSSVAYATEEILLVLVVAGSSALAWVLPIALAIAVLLVAVVTSYYQTIHGYPSGGGAYVVAHDNLGVWPGLTAGAALLIDYVLTVAVSVTAGIAAVTSAFPFLIPFRVALCLVAVALITWANLRGVRESSTIFAIPTYAFVLIVLALIATGLLRLATGYRPERLAGPLAPSSAGQHALTTFLVLRAFASGCTALTGVEAISNGVPAFRQPEADNAGKTLIAMGGLLATMFVGISLLARLFGLSPLGDQTVVSMIGRRVFGGGPLYLLLQFATMLILVLAANTSFADLPRLAAILARDQYLPEQLTNLGDRLVFVNGIITLAAFASGLILISGGRTHRLIPLYALGVFLSFTLSQAGMVHHWWRLGGANWRLKAGINGLGAAATGLVLLVIAVSKFVLGAWVVVLLIPLFVWMLHAIRGHYTAMEAQLALPVLRPEERAEPISMGPYKVMVPVLEGIH